ncbi:MAG TPA: glycosyltransferase family 39 protein [Dehalococcoidia bacterium]|nr:glycosyltransferase family 39 protein [Dehalococcoidia bacterium]
MFARADQPWYRTAAARWALAVFAVALVVRLGVVAYVHPDPRDGRYDDSVWYDTTARHLAAGDGYVFDPTVWKAPDGTPIYPGEHQLTPTALWPPGYPVTLAAIYKLTGDSETAGRLANVLFGSLTCVFVYLIARRLFDQAAAIFAGFALALLPSHALFTAVLLSETYFGFLLGLLLTLTVYFVLDRDRPNLPLLVGLGALTAFAGYVRGEFLAYGGVLALLMLLHWRRNAVLPLVAFAVGAALIVTPWAVRNRIQMGEVIVGTTGSGRVSYQGHNPQTDGGASLTAVGQLEAPFAGLGRKQIELQSNSEGSRLARDWALHHKLRELELIPQRMYRLFRSDESGVTWIQSDKPWFSAQGADRLIRLSDFTFFGLIALALAGLPLWWRPRDLKHWAVFALVPFYMVVFGVLFIGDPRYHYALYLPIAIFAGPALASLWSAAAAGWRDVAGGRTPAELLRGTGAPRP